jgi:predicted transcriptional regulator of viral defense system
MRFADFVEILLENTKFAELLLTSPEYKPIRRYSYGEPDPYLLGVSLREGAYLSHGSALELHGLSAPSRTVYVNKEQSEKPAPTLRLSQDAIDRAFRGRGRSSNYRFTGANRSYVILGGKHTGRLQVEPVRLPDGRTLDVTGFERTLIDATVRPAYCGGIENVASAYLAAKKRVTANALLKILSSLQYVYPYHQAVGFYMQHAGYPADEVAQVAGIPKRFKFYLGYEMRDPLYSEEWMLYYPQTLLSVK